MSAGASQVYSNSEIAVVTGSGSSHDFSGNYYPRHWNGRVFYHHGTRLQGDCATGRQAVTAQLSNFTFTLGQDTIIDILDTLVISAPNGMIGYEWFDGDPSQEYQLIASDLGVGIYFISVQVIDSLLCSHSDTIIVAITDLVGLDALELVPSVYPNPTDGLLYFKDAEFKSIDIFTITGSYIRSVALEASSINISDLSDGCYFIRVSGEQSKPIKILKFAN